MAVYTAAFGSDLKFTYVAERPQLLFLESNSTLFPAFSDPESSNGKRDAAVS